MTVGCRMGSEGARLLFAALLGVGCAHGELRVARLAGVGAGPAAERVRVIRRVLVR